MAPASLQRTTIHRNINTQQCSTPDLVLIASVAFFFWPSDRGAESRCHYMFDALDAIRGLEPHVQEAGEELAAALVAAERESRTTPPDFGAVAFPAYLRGIQKRDYWFSCEELLWVAECA